MKRFALAVLLSCLLWSCSAPPEIEEATGGEYPQVARNVILVIGDGVGIPTLNAASLYGYGEPLSLFVQNMPNIGLSDTSAADSWVSDSAAGMTAIVTGVKTNNGVVSMGPDTVRGSKDGEVLKTLWEYAEESGLATGVVSNSPMADATPAACYAHSNDRQHTGTIFKQVLEPRYGDGIDVIIGPGAKGILDATQALGLELFSALKDARYEVVSTETDMVNASRASTRLVALYDSSDYDLAISAESALRMLRRNPKGFFLMIESNNHSENVEATLKGAVAMDQMIRQLAENLDGDTLLLFTADHSYDYRIPKGKRGDEVTGLVRVADTHTAEEVLVSAVGPGSSRVKGTFPNTFIFTVIKEAMGW